MYELLDNDGKALIDKYIKVTGDSMENVEDIFNCMQNLNFVDIFTKAIELSKKIVILSDERTYDGEQIII